MHNIPIIILFILIMACDPRQSLLPHDAFEIEEDIVFHIDQEIGFEPPRTAEPPPFPKNTLYQSKIIKKAQLNFEVSKLDIARWNIDSIVQAIGGYYADEKFISLENKKSFSITVRVPSDNFELVIKQLENGIGKLTTKNINTQDVTEEYEDLNIRMENKQSYLNRYQSILKEAKTVKEILEVQEHIRILEEEIESKKGRIKFLDHYISYSTINLLISELTVVELQSDHNFLVSIESAFNHSIEGILNTFLALVKIWPILFSLLLLYLSRKRIARFIRVN